jgi:ABC-type multidrug transport system fused ATPase/permease subunit
MINAKIIPDTFIVVQDTSDQLSILMKRWYSDNRQQIDERIEKRLAQEREQEAAARLLEETKAAEALRTIEQSQENDQNETLLESGVNEASIDKEESNLSLESESDLIDDENQAIEENINARAGAETLEKIVEEDESKDSASAILSRMAGAVVMAATSSVLARLNAEHAASAVKLEGVLDSAKIEIPKLQTLPDKGPETQEFLNTCRASTEALQIIVNSIATLTGSEPAYLDVNSASGEKSMQEYVDEAVGLVERLFGHRAIEFDAEEPEENEDDDDEEAEIYSDEEDEEEEQDNNQQNDDDDEVDYDPSLNEQKLSFGYSNHYCIVTLHNKQILAPGSVDIQCKYKGLLYRFVSEEARQIFMSKPDLFVPDNGANVLLCTPAPRIIILGPRGAGKSTQARELARRLDIFHVKFRDYLQELIVGKTKKRIEPEKDEDKQLEELDAEDQEELLAEYLEF